MLSPLFLPPSFPPFGSSSLHPSLDPSHTLTHNLLACCPNSKAQTHRLEKTKANKMQAASQ